jgi:ribose/xylose/arabinose/galactoside ABC-type transport system permease subunit
MSAGKVIIILGFILIVIGLLWLIFQKHLQWFGNLPGDFKWNNEQVKFYFPLSTMLLISIAINICWWIYKWLMK